MRKKHSKPISNRVQNITIWALIRHQKVKGRIIGLSMSPLTLRRGYAWLILVAPIFLPCCSGRSFTPQLGCWGPKVAKAHLFYSLVLDLKERNEGFLKRSSGEAKRVFSWLERGKPLGFLNPRAQLSLGKGRRLKKKRKI